MARRSKNKNKQQPPAVNWRQNKLDSDWLKPWDLSVQAVYWINPDCWKLKTDRGFKRLVKVNWSEARLFFIQSMLDHLGQSGFKTIPRFIRTMDEAAWVRTDSSSALYLCDWVEGKPLKLTNPEELSQTTQTLAKLHLCLRNFQAPPGAECWDNRGRWPEIWRQQSKQLQAYRQLAEDAVSIAPNPFDQFFLENYARLQNQLLFALSSLEDSPYQECLEMTAERPFVCHNAFREANLLLTNKQKIQVCGFEKSIYDLRVYELGRFLQRVLIQANWDLGVGMRVLNEYEEVWPLTPAERRIMLAQLWFPYLSWTFSQYYYTGGREIPADQLLRELKREQRGQKARETFLTWAHDWAH